jgi:SAM-dependent methyltransferase
MDSDPELPFHNEPLAGDESEIRARHESNRSSWNEGARHYTDNLDQAIASLRAGISNYHPVERRSLGDLHRFHTAIHLQCASGRDTLSLWLEGVQRVIGVDISDVHIANARVMSAALNAPAEWYRCDVLDTPHTLDGSADLVYTGRGAINWLQDLAGWAQVIYRLLKPGGTFHIYDSHPFVWLVDYEASQLKFIGIDYFNHADSGKGWPDTYIGDTIGIPVEEQSTHYERLWTLGEVVTTLAQAGLQIISLGEHPEDYWDSLPLLPEAQKKGLPLTFSILARKPEA